MNSTRSNDHMIQAMGDPSISGRPPDSIMGSNPQLQPPPNTTLSMTSFPGLGLGGLGDHQIHQHLLQGPGSPGSGPAPPPPPRCQIMNPFLGTPPLVPHADRMQQGAAAGGSSLGQMENAFSQDMRHRGYPGVLGLPPPFQVHPNLQSQIQAFQQDMGQHGHMTQPPGFLHGFIPADIVSAVPDARSSHLLQPHVRQRARRRSRANRASSIQHAMHENTGIVGISAGSDAASATLGRSREMPVPTAQITVDSAFGDSAPGAAGAARLEDAKLKGLEENYSSIGENFECNICFQKANEAVVTCCGHLFCWPCLYRWLHIHSYHKECPVCKGAIDESTITPIYGREFSAVLSARGLPGGSAAERIPPRPPARRVESARQLREREDRGREREQRERALEREREREQSESRGLAEVLGQGVVTALIEEGASGMRDSGSSAVHSAVLEPGGSNGGEVGGGEISITTSSGGSHRQQEEIDSTSSGGHEDSSSSGGGPIPQTATGPPGVNTASSFQDLSSLQGGGAAATSTIHPPGTTVSHAVPATAPGLGGGTGSTPTAAPAPAFLQRRVSDRREQLRAALAASARSGTVSSISSLADRVDERRQMIAAAALLSQEWEDIVNISRLVGPVNPVQAAAWMAAVQGRLGSTEGTSLESMDHRDFPSHQQHFQHGGPGVMLHSQPAHRSTRHMIASPAMISQDGSSQGGDDHSALSRLVTVNPLQAGDWLAAMRSRLTSMEKIVENLESPLQVLQQTAASGVATSLQMSLPPGGLGQSSPSHLRQGWPQAQVVFHEASSAPATPGLEELSLLDVVQPSSASNSTATSMEDGPSARAVQERAAAATESPPVPAPRQASSSSTLTTTPHQSNARTHSEPRLHYQEAPVPKPPSTSRRRSARTGEEAASSMNIQGQAAASVGQPHAATAEGSGCTGPPETMSARPKRRRLD